MKGEDLLWCYLVGPFVVGVVTPYMALMSIATSLYDNTQKEGLAEQLCNGVISNDAAKVAFSGYIADWQLSECIERAAFAQKPHASVSAPWLVLPRGQRAGAWPYAHLFALQISAEVAGS